MSKSITEKQKLIIQVATNIYTAELQKHDFIKHPEFNITDTIQGAVEDAYTLVDSVIEGDC